MELQRGEFSSFWWSLWRVFLLEVLVGIQHSFTQNESKFGKLTSNCTKCTENFSIFTKKTYYNIILYTTIKASNILDSAFFVQVIVALPVPCLRKYFTLRVCFTLSTLNKLGKLPDFPGFRIVCQERPRTSDANTYADCNKAAPEFKILNI